MTNDRLHQARAMGGITLLFVAVLALASCASLNQKVFENIHQGDTKEHVVQTLGQPDSFSAIPQYPGMIGYRYKKGADICGIAFQNDVVADIACTKDPNYVSPLAAFGKGLQGAGQGLQNASQNRAPSSTTNCTTTGGGGIYNTNCQSN